MSEKAEDFSALSSQEIVEASSDAIVEKVDTDIIALADGLSNSVGTTATAMSVSTFREGYYTLRLNKARGPFISVLHPTQVDDIIAEILTSDKSPWANSGTELNILGGQAALDNGFVVSLLDIPIYSTVNTKSINAAADWAGYMGNPLKSFAFGEDSRGIRVRMGYNVQEGVKEIGVNMYYDAKERIDAQGIKVVSTQTA